MGSERTYLGLLTSTVLLLAACSGGGGAPEPTVPPSPAASTAPTEPIRAPLEDPPVQEVSDGVPDVDLAIRIVDLSDIHFDTFDGRSVRLDRSTIDLRRRLFDAIRPLDSPSYDEAEGGSWLEAEDLVIGYVSGGEAYAYPHKILNFHEIVNDNIDGVPVLVSYCPLCRSGVVFDRRLDGRELSFSNTSALYESDLVMVDRETGSYWWQVPGRAIVGTLSGAELTVLPSVTTTWADWSGRYPDTQVLSRDTGSPIDYTRDPFVGYQDRVDGGIFAFPVDEAALDDRLTPGALVLGVEAGGMQRAYPVELIGPAPVNDEVGGQAIVVFVWEGGAAAYSSSAGGRALTFVPAGHRFVDRETESVWTRDGLAEEGPLQGTRLEAVPTRTTFWFAYVGAFPAAEVYTP